MRPDTIYRMVYYPNTNEFNFYPLPIAEQERFSRALTYPRPIGSGIDVFVKARSVDEGWKKSIDCLVEFFGTNHQRMLEYQKNSSPTDIF